MRFSERRVPMAGWMMLLGAGVCAMNACSRNTPGADSPRVGTTVGPVDVRSALLAETTNYNFGPNREATKVDTTLAVGSPPPWPTVQIATATRIDTTNRPHANRFIQRLHSDTSHARLGLAPGDNYVWRDSTSTSAGGTWRLLVVPVNASYPMVWLSTDSTRARPLIDSAGDAPFVRALNGIFQCDAGCSPHCGQSDKRAVFDASRDASSIVIRVVR